MRARSYGLTERDQPYAKDRIIVCQMQVPNNLNGINEPDPSNRQPYYLRPELLGRPLP
jgi:hypothetical protein